MSAEPLIKQEDILKRVKSLAEEVAKDYEFDTVVGLLTGAFIFVSDFCRAMPRKDLRVHFIKASSYGGSMQSSREVKVKGLDSVNLEGKKVLLLDDILDTGHTLSGLVKMLKEKGAQEVRTCAFLDKPERREVDFEVDYSGFKIPNAFVVGYGLDFDDDYRAYPDIWTLEEE